MQKVFITVSSIFLDEESHRPLFMNNQKMPGSVKLNQLANNAAYHSSQQMTWLDKVGYTYHQAQGIAEYWNGFRNYPGKDPEGHSKADP